MTVVVWYCVAAANEAHANREALLGTVYADAAGSPIAQGRTFNLAAQTSKQRGLHSQDKGPTKEAALQETTQHTAGPAGSVNIPDQAESRLLARDPLDSIQLDNIKPLYTSPAMPGEGVWVSSGSPRDASGRPIVYRTFYRPSVDFPNAVVYMMVVDMSKAFAQYYVGSQEPGAPMARSEVEPELRSRIMAVTNAMWMQRHSKGAGAIFRGKVIYPMTDGMATFIIYKDGSVDIREWSSEIPLQLVRDARQLRHLIVKNGMVVQSIYRKGRLEDSEIGLGFLLGGGGRDQDGKHYWFVAHRSAFGVRKDGNLVFAIGHHIGSKDLAKALVLAGCERGMHADANPDNIVGNLYLRDAHGNLVKKLKLSPEQPKYTLNRYEDRYSKDFFAFFLRDNAAPSATNANSSGLSSKK
ncbi:MAG: hypothetical protein ACP5M0_00245 [Desulfomonilaceae bacterium]